MLCFCVRVWFFFIGAFSLSRAEVVIDSDGGFTNLVVGINPEIPESDIKGVLSNLEHLFRNATCVLHTATRGRTYFKQVVFALPKRYRSVPLDTEWRTESAPFRQPEVLLTNHGARPYAQQHRGCGQPGLRIQLPLPFLKGAKSNKAKSFVREWAKYRYGVFEESGSVDDEMYPACYTVPGSETTKVTDCTNKEASYEIRKPPENPSSCIPVPMKGGNYHVASSLMNDIEFPEVTHFCDDNEYPHNKFTPSKHNNLCRRQSTWNIISKHGDFHKEGLKLSRVNEESVTFKYVMEPDIRLVLGVDTSDEMEKNDRMDMVSNAFSYFILNDLPENSMVEVKDLKNQNKIPLLVTINTPADAEKLLDAFPETGGQGNVCVHCAIEQALEDLKRNTLMPQGHIVIISAHGITEDILQSLERKLDASDVPLHVLYFNRRLKEPPFLQKLCLVSGGLFHYIPDDENSLAVLYEAFRSIYESLSWMNRNRVLINQMAFSNSTCKSCDITFLTDKSMENFQVLLTGPKFVDGPPVVKDKTILSNGNQEFVPGHSSFSYKRKIPAYVFSMKDPKPGFWSLNFERKSGFNQPLVVIIRSSSSKHNSIAHMSAWAFHQEYSKAQEKPPVAFYSEVEEKSLPMNDIKVSASLYYPYSKSTININLFDIGDGDPDVTRKDGIFSKYFTEDSFGGYYVVTMKAESYYDENLNHSIADAESAPAKPFQRVTTLSSFYLPSQSRTVFFPPRRISDLRVKLFSKKNIVAYELKWTSPGNNYDSGSVSEYQVRLFHSIKDAEENFNDSYDLKINDFNVHGQMLTRETVSGSSQVAIIEPRNLNSATYYFAMRTKNDQGMLSEVSNVVEIHYIAPTTTSDPVTDEYGSTIYTVSPGDDPEDQPISLSSRLGLALGLTLGILLFCFIIGCILFFYFKRHRKNEKEHHKSHTTDHRFLNDVSQKSESHDVLCQSTNALNVSVISPVNSWPANSLITHYESIKKDKNSESSMDLSIPKDSSDTISVSSSKYSNANQVNPDYPVYDAVCFNTLNRDDTMNYPSNPGYAPFNPVYTSSLRKENNFRNGYSPNCSILDVSSLRSQGAVNPVYMSSLPRPQAFDRLLDDQSFSNMSHSSYSLNSQGKRRLGTDV